jgi:ketosteroid isomerase-like protein
MSRLSRLRAPLSALLCALLSSPAFAQAEPPIPPESLHTAPHTRPHTSPHTLPHTAPHVDPHVRPHRDPHVIPHGGVAATTTVETSVVEQRSVAVESKTTVRRSRSRDSSAVARAIGQFHEALAAGDRAAALALLDEKVIVLESGGSESRKEYESHHLASDIEFARAVKSERGPTVVTVDDDLAWAWSTSTARGEFRGKPVNSTGAELMVLRRAADQWRIVAIHWSSRKRS